MKRQAGSKGFGYAVMWLCGYAVMRLFG